MIALALFGQGRTDEVRSWARHARNHFAQLTEEKPDDHEARLLWASSELLLDEFAAARTILERGLVRANLREFHRLLANAYLAEVVALEKEAGDDPGARLILLE